MTGLLNITQRKPQVGVLPNTSRQINSNQDPSYKPKHTYQVPALHCFYYSFLALLLQKQRFPRNNVFAFLLLAPGHLKVHRIA